MTVLTRRLYVALLQPSVIHSLDVATDRSIGHCHRRLSYASGHVVCSIVLVPSRSHGYRSQQVC